MKEEEMGGACSEHEETKCAYYRISVRKREGNSALGTPRRSWENNIKMDLTEMGLKGADCIRQAQDRDRWWALVNTVMKVRFQVLTAVSMKMTSSGMLHHVVW
jgi:hypothetical protein